MDTPVSVYRRLREQLAAYPRWLRVLLWPIAALMLLLSPIALAWMLPGAVAAWIWRRVSPYPPFRQLAVLFHAELWRDPQARPLHPYDLLTRERTLRRILPWVLLVEWSALITLGGAGSFALLLDRQVFAVTLPAVMLLMLTGLLAAPLQAYHLRIFKRWAETRQPLCGTCGYNRLGVVEPRCPECGSARPPIAPGRVPPEWGRRLSVINHGAVFIPFSLLGTVPLLVGALSGKVPGWLLGSILGALTISVLAIAGIAIARVLARRPRGAK